MLPKNNIRRGDKYFIYFSHSKLDFNSGASGHDLIFYKSLLNVSKGFFVSLDSNIFKSDKFLKFFFPLKVVCIYLYTAMKFNKSKIIFCNTGDSFIVHLLPRIFRTKVCILSHGLEVMWKKEFSFLRKRRIFYNKFILFPMVNFTLKKADLIFALNQDELKYIRKHFKYPQVECTSSGYFSDGNKLFSNQNQSRRLVFLGGFNLIRKGIDLIISVLNEGFIGFGIDKILFAGIDDSGIQFIKKNVNNTVSIEFKNKYNRFDLNNILHDGDIILIPSRFEGSPLVMFESLSHGLAPVVAQFSSAKDWITDGVNGTIFKFYNSSQLKNAIQTHLTRKFDSEFVAKSISKANWDNIMFIRIAQLKKLNLL